MSAVDEDTRDDEGAVAKKMRTGNQSLGIAVLVRLKRVPNAQKAKYHDGNCYPGERRRKPHMSRHNTMAVGPVSNGVGGRRRSR